MASATTIVTPVGMLPAYSRSAITVAERPSSEPTDRSISPWAMTTNMPRATTAVTEVCRMRLTMFRSLRNTPSVGCEEDQPNNCNGQYKTGRRASLGQKTLGQQTAARRAFCRSGLGRRILTARVALWLGIGRQSSVELAAGRQRQQFMPVGPGGFKECDLLTISNHQYTVREAE